MIRISALSFKDSFLEDLKLLNKSYPDVMLFYSGQKVSEFNKQYSTITDIVLVDPTTFDPNKGEMVRQIKELKPDILILAFMELMMETDIAAWMSSGVDGIIPHYAGEKEIYISIKQLFTKRKFIHPDLTALVFGCFKTSSPKRLESSRLKPKSLIVLDLLSKGKSYAQISNEMDTSMDSVRYYIKDIYGVLGIKNKGAAVGMYLRGQIA